MVSATDEILSGIEYRAGLETLRQRMNKPDNPSQLETAVDNSKHRRNESRTSRLRGYFNRGFLYGATAIATLAPSLPVEVYQFLTNRPTLERMIERGAPVTIGIGAAACGGRELSNPTAPTSTTISEPNPTPPDPNPTPTPTPNPTPVPAAVEFEVPIVGLYGGQSAGKGSFPIPSLGLNIPIVDGKIKATKDMGLMPGQYTAGPIKTDIGEDRYAIVDVSALGMSVNLGGGRLETILNVIERDPRIAINNPQEFARYALKDNGRSKRITAPLKIGLLDSFVYSVDERTGNLIRGEPHTMNGTARTALYNILRNDNKKNDASFWSNGLYPTGDLLTGDFFKVQSREDMIPENRRTNGWLIIYPYRDIPIGYSILQSDVTNNRGEIISAAMGFGPGYPVPEISWLRDMRECFGWAQVRDSAVQTETMRKYAKFLFSRPPGLELDDRAISYNTNPASQQGFGILDLFSGFSRR